MICSAARWWTEGIADGARTTADGACVFGAARRIVSTKDRSLCRTVDPYEASSDGDEIGNCLMARRSGRRADVGERYEERADVTDAWRSCDLLSLEIDLNLQFVVLQGYLSMQHFAAKTSERTRD